jgi:myo-inositol 2-dehydrogenase/D-chiro-inositol 1-dehydrogenase
MADENMQASRREFVAAAGAIAATGAFTVLSRGQDKPAANTSGNETIKVGLVGCGGRGGGAAVNALDADNRVKIVALADVFKDRLEGAHNNLKSKYPDRIDVGERKFLGFDAYKEVMKTDADYVILATPPHFRPYHIQAAVDAKKHVFTEKPVAVDPWGVRAVIAAGEKAKQLGLSIVAGTQRRHQGPYVEAAKMVRDGAIGKVVAARAYWNQTQLWHNKRGRDWSDMEWMLRDWVNWCWLSGDHIVEQHVHNIDVVNWFVTESRQSATPVHPVKAVGMGGRAHRPTGDQYDYFAVDFVYDDGVHMASYCRQINDCDRNVSEAIIGEKGYLDTNAGFRLVGANGQPLVSGGGGRSRGKGKGKGKGSDQPRSGPFAAYHPDPYVQEHKDLIASLTNNGKLNEAANVATSTMTAIMGRVAAYTGEEVSWDKLLNSELRLGPKEFNFDVKLPENAKPPVPGRA